MQQKLPGRRKQISHVLYKKAKRRKKKRESLCREDPDPDPDPVLFTHQSGSVSLFSGRVTLSL